MNTLYKGISRVDTWALSGWSMVEDCWLKIKRQKSLGGTHCPSGKQGYCTGREHFEGIARYTVYSHLCTTGENASEYFGFSTTMSSWMERNIRMRCKASAKP